MVCMQLNQASHEAVYRFVDEATGTRAIVAIHSTALGPAGGGCRLWSYASEEEAVRDALRLSEGMTYKNALAGLPLGGGKAVLIPPPEVSRPDFDRAAMFRAFGRFVERLDGGYVTAEDVGTSVSDMLHVAEETRHVAGLPQRAGSAGGDPSPWTALGVFLSLKAAVRHRCDSDLQGTVVGVQGLGHVGLTLCRLLDGAGARLVVTDLDPERCARAAELFGATVVAPDALIATPMDVFAPCAMGGVLTEESARAIQARVVCGAANNQLADSRVGRLLAERGVLYAPDYLVNAGGIINVAAEYLGETPASVEARVNAIPQRLMQLVQRAAGDSRPMNELADEMARSIVFEGRSAQVA